MKNPNIALCIWAGPVAYVLFVLSGVAGGNFTPISADMTPAEVVAHYQAHLTGIRLASVLFLMSPAFFIAFCAAISAELRRIEGDFSPLAWSQLMVGLFIVLPFVPTAIFWTDASYRLDRAPEITQALNDAAWLFDVMPGAPGGFQDILIGLAILCDRHRVRIFPLWLAWFNFLVGIIFFGGCVVGFAKTGPFSWNGLFPYWLPTLAFTAWIPVMTVMLLRNNRGRPDTRPII
jgi:hypothetical protein